MATKDWKVKYDYKFQKSWTKGNKEVFVSASYVGDGKYKWSASVFDNDEANSITGTLTSKEIALRKAKQYMRGH